MTHYRESWYLDAWDEDKAALRCFAIDRILTATLLDEKAADVAEVELDAHYASSYGIFGGAADKMAVLRFTRERARWVADEVWHPEQTGRYLEDGSYELRIPYRDSRELVMDILRHGPHVVVIEPRSLLDEVKSQLAGALRRYDRTWPPLREWRETGRRSDKWAPTEEVDAAAAARQRSCQDCEVSGVGRRVGKILSVAVE